MEEISGSVPTWRVVVNKVRALCHEATQQAEASPVIVAALELCTEVEKMGVMMEEVGGLIADIDAALEAVR